MSDDPVLRRCGVRFSPPAILLTYSSNGRLRRRTMPLRHFTKKSGISRVAAELRESPRHAKYLSALPQAQLEKLVTIVHDQLNGMSLDDSLRKNNKLDKVDPNEDLNKVDSETLSRKKGIMQSSFEKHRKKRGDDNFEYDVEVDFEGAVESCEWDSDKESCNEF